MHGKDSAENRKQQAAYYDEYTERQARIGVNDRHKSILNKIRANGLKESDRVLEIGCGIGTFSGLLAKALPNGKAICLDLSPKSIELAKQNYANLSNLEFIATNALEFDFGNDLFDQIVLPDVIEHIPLDLHQALFEKLAKVLKPLGSIHIHIPNPAYLDWCHEHRPDLLQIIDLPVFTEKLLGNIRPAGLHIHKLETYCIWVVDGDYQFIVLKKDGFQDFTQVVEEKITFWDKLKHKLGSGK